MRLYSIIGSALWLIVECVTGGSFSAVRCSVGLLYTTGTFSLSFSFSFSLSLSVAVDFFCFFLILSAAPLFNDYSLGLFSTSMTVGTGSTFLGDSGCGSLPTSYNSWSRCRYTSDFTKSVSPPSNPLKSPYSAHTNCIWALFLTTGTSPSSSIHESFWS